MSETAPDTGIATAGILAITFVWGVSFVLTKDVLADLPAADFLAERFVVATAVMLAVRPRALRGLGSSGWWHGTVIGLILAFSFLTQTYGLRTTPAAVSGFITGMFVIFTPLLGALVLRARIGATAWTATLVSLTGLTLLSLGTPAGHDPATTGGELLTFASAIGWAAHINATGAWTGRHDPYALAVVQLGVTAVVSLLTALPGDLTGRGGLAMPARPADWLILGYTALLCTAAAFCVQTFAQRRISATRTAVVMTTEPVFAGLAGAVAGERLGALGYLGAALVLAAMYLVELRRSR